jgi:hypothetical protein
MVDNYISPNFTWEKLENPSFDDLVDVFEDRIRNWLLEPAKSLLQLPHGFVATISLLLTYFESIQTYLSGQDSNGASQRFFIDGFLAVFGSPGIDKSQSEKMARTMFTEGLCGFLHNGTSGVKIQYSKIRNEALTVTQQKVNGKVDYDGEIRSIVINPDRFHWCVQRHFDKYISDLRNVENETLRENFKKAVDIKWDLEGQEPIIGMTEEEFQQIHFEDNLMEEQQEDGVKFLDYIVAYSDLMGQEDKLNQLRRIPTNGQEKEQFNKNASQTYAPVRYIREGLRMSAEFVKSVPPAYIDVTVAGPKSDVLKKKVESDLQLHFYSDFFAITCRYSNDDDNPLIQHVFNLLSTLSFMTIKSLGNDTPLRGGVEIGKAFEWHEEGDVGVYGPVMLDAYKLESEFAWYPRIVIGEKLNESINNWNEKINEGDSYYADYKEIIEFCNRIIRTDKDGIPTLDYLGPDIFHIVQSISDRNMAKNVQLGWKFVNNKYERLKNDKKFQLALKYSLLKDYYSERLAIWNIE